MQKKNSKTIPMVDLGIQYSNIKKDIDGAIASVIADTAFIGGKYVSGLEGEIASYCKTEYAIGVNSGTDALYLSLWALGIGEGDEVITTPFTFFATAEVISRLGAKPVFVDIDPYTFNINADLIESKITKKTKAIIPVHLFGLVADMGKINKTAKKHKLFVVEDACQAIGASYKGVKSGNLGDTGCFSFFPSKNLGAYGDGGMVVTNNALVAERIKSLRNHGSKIKYHNDHIGVSSRLDGIQASIISAKLKYLNDWNKARRKAADTYNQLLKNTPFLQLPVYPDPDYYHVYHQYTLRINNDKRDALKEHLLEKGISSMVYYPIPLHVIKAMEYLGYKKGSLPEVEKVSEEVLSLPIYPEISEDQISFIARSVISFLKD